MHAKSNNGSRSLAKEAVFRVETRGAGGAVKPPKVSSERSMGERVGVHGFNVCTSPYSVRSRTDSGWSRGDAGGSHDVARIQWRGRQQSRGRPDPGRLGCFLWNDS